MADTFRCRIVTPTAAVLDEDAVYASVPSWDGQFGVMHGQAPLLARLDMGALRVDVADGGTRWYLVEGGFAHVTGDALTILTERATDARELTVEEAERALAEANARLAGGGVDPRKTEAEQRRAYSARRLASTPR